MRNKKVVFLFSFILFIACCILVSVFPAGCHSEDWAGVTDQSGAAVLPIPHGKEYLVGHVQEKQCYAVHGQALRRISHLQGKLGTPYVRYRVEGKALTKTQRAPGSHQTCENGRVFLETLYEWETYARWIQRADERQALEAQLEQADN
jgi:hypothetical protein